MKIDAPVDMHVHFRQGDALDVTVPLHDQVFEYALAMPNLVPPILTGPRAADYLLEIQQRSYRMKTLTSIAANAETNPVEFHYGVAAAKLYPKGVTTNSDHGITMQELWDGALDELCYTLSTKDRILCVHAERPESFCLQKELDFLPMLDSIATRFPRLRIVLEHVSSEEGVHFVQHHANVAATVTLHHMLLTLDNVIGQVHNFCKPVAKRPADRDAILQAVFGGHPRFFFGSDSAPHPRSSKECAVACAGCFTAPCLIESLVQLFYDHNKSEMLNDFVSTYARRWYKLPDPGYNLEFKRGQTRIPADVGGYIPWRAGYYLEWELA